MKATNEDGDLGPLEHLNLHVGVDRFVEETRMLTTRQREAYLSVRAVMYWRSITGKQDLALRHTYLTKDSGVDTEMDLSHIRARYRKDREIYRQFGAQLMQQRLERIAQTIYCYQQTLPQQISAKIIQERCGLTIEESNEVLNILLKHKAVVPAISSKTKAVVQAN